MLALFGLFAIIILSITVIRIGSIAFELTGLSPEVATFQAQSVFSGVGFTTDESETIVSHPVRRKIARLLMLLGSAGITSTIATFILTFLGESSKTIIIRIIVLFLGLIIIYLLSRSKLIYSWMKKVIKKALARYTSLSLFDYQEILGLRKGYTVSRIKVNKNNWMVGKQLHQLNLHMEGILILAVNRLVNGKEKFIGAPQAHTTINEGDLLICYGRGETSKELSSRDKGKKGDFEHNEAVEKERKISAAEKQTGQSLES
ncbi:MAG: potassium transporter TrkA [Candidatus Omnitrophica bacterium]|nr:potassium transporter TrkA [Candidatus Omnitrophota bacterium]MCF7877788.1 potassium transporter TrkA [Candidatus Omnitrophota bacterium]MCF7892115.1 potassium transporter TrkA [Candidatus Omnitrophota bacterium]MCF7896166.1 potassium transporter TrkA [Candidatus Omnitrophota bacterium]MCF7897769.1 potassium transporter TrkA [Candidatus Omnitrophota bacterium]